jgi:sodium/bile acid cotransporter 7
MPSVLRTLAQLGLDGFLLGLVAAVLLAWVWPQPGASGGVLHAELASTVGVGLLFFLYGLKLSPRNLRAGLTRWKLHLIVQSGTFLVFPAVVLAMERLAGGALAPELRLGFFLVAAIPSTVSSSVAMTAIAGGNIAGAIFNATFSSIIGVVATPLWIAWYLAGGGVTLPLGPVILKIVLLLVAPVVVGQLARRWLAGWAARHDRATRLVDRGLILAIVYNAFADSMIAGVWSQHGAGTIATALAFAAVLFALVVALMVLPGRLVGLGRGDLVAALFCGSTKSLATGVPMAKLMFGAVPALGLILAPLMIYHLFQLTASSVIARRLAATAPQRPAGPL